MTEHSHSKDGLLAAVKVRLATVDDLAAARKLQAEAFKVFATAEHGEAEAEAIRAVLDSPRAADALRNQSLYSAFLDGTMVAMAGWALSDDSGRSARLGAVAVHPMFGYLGLGRMIAGCAEQGARKAGFPDVIVHAPVSIEGFFSRLGYETTAHGVRTLGPGFDLRVTYMRKRLVARIAKSQSEQDGWSEQRIAEAGAAPAGVLHHRPD